ncbi:MAG: ribonuclease R [Peptoanaerobacter stomatis]|uniref:ribonuclease R n=1 Tax=Peptoanaerobacter stomatis TaxID=796937 RepID=UPI003F9FB515
MSEDLKESLIDFLSKKDTHPQDFDEICAFFQDIQADEVQNILDEMVEDGLVVKTPKKQKYTVPEKLGMKAGIVLMTQKGFAFIRPSLDERDIFVSRSDLMGAMDKDKVLIEITRPQKDEQKAEGKVVQILQRNIDTVIGRYQRQKDYGFVIPLSRKITSDIYIPKKYENGAREGDTVECEIYQYAQSEKKAEGKIIKIIADKNDKDVYFKAIFAENKLSENFPAKVLKEVSRIPEDINMSKVQDRLDLRDEFIFTIDGWDAKDLDDAISISKLQNGNYSLGVHIADVSEYVTENTALDSEAFRRGTSVYLVDTVVPMLPEKLSNGVCSLHPNVDRLALSCIMEIDNKGKVVNHKIQKSIINSHARLVYTEVSDFLENGDETVLKKDEILREVLTLSDELAKLLREHRFARGAMDFNFPESSIEMDENKNVIDIRPEERRIGNKIIEEFMLITNETIAEEFYWASIPFVYRVHEYPDVDKLRKLLPILETYNYKLKIDDDVHPKQLQDLLDNLNGKKEEEVISTLLLRSLKKARYSPICLGHFSLSLKYYCHFTSPIRRYPDLQIHRIIKEYLDGKIDERRAKYLDGVVAKASEQSSLMEQMADDAERQVDDLRKAQYMTKFVGDTFEGVISSVTNFGIFVRLDNTVEGLVRFVDMMDDRYEFDETNYAVIGKSTGKKYTLGDKIKVKVVRTSEEFREVDFAIVR